MLEDLRKQNGVGPTKNWYNNLVNARIKTQILIQRLIYHQNKQSWQSNVNGILGEVDKLDLVDIAPVNIPDHISKLFVIHNPGGKWKRN